MKIDPRSLHQGKKLKIAQLKAIASLLDGKLSLSLDHRSTKKGMTVFRGDIELVVPNEKEKEAKKQLHAFDIQLLQKEDVKTWLKPSTIARFKASNGGKPIGKSHDGRWILCPSKRVLTDEQAFAPFLMDPAVWISQGGISFPTELGYTEIAKFPLSTLPQPLQPWCERIAAIFGKSDQVHLLEDLLVEEEENILSDEENVIGGDAQNLLSRLETCIETEHMEIPEKPVIDASGLASKMFHALLLTALFSKEKIVIHSSMVWDKYLLSLLRQRKQVVWIVPEIHEGMSKYFDCEIYRFGNEYVLERSINIGKGKAPIRERFTPIWDVFPWDEN